MSFRKTIWLYITIFKIKPISHYQILDYCIDWSLFRKFYHFKMERYSKYDRPSSSKIWLFNRYLVYTFQLLLVYPCISRRKIYKLNGVSEICASFLPQNTLHRLNLKELIYTHLNEIEKKNLKDYSKDWTNTKIDVA